MVTGSLDLQKVLGEQHVQFAPGLLSKAHRGLLYVDEVNLLPDALVDLLLDAAASGVNHIERDGISHQHEAEFTLMGTMNPDEGELRPSYLTVLVLAWPLRTPTASMNAWKLCAVVKTLTPILPNFGHLCEATASFAS